MNILLVTSQITYMPGNYQGLLERLFALQSGHIKGLVLLNNLDRQVLKSTAGLFYLGARHVATSLLKNIISLKLKKREQLAGDYQIPIFNWDSMNQREACDWVKSNDIDMIINLRTRCIYKNEILNLPTFGCFNIHHGLLPKYRGTLCDLYALTENRPAGFTLHQMNQKIDDGKIIKTVEVDQGLEKDYCQYLNRTMEFEAQALSEFIDSVLNHQEVPQGLDNRASDIIYSKNPTRKQIQKFLKEGMIL